MSVDEVKTKLNILLTKYPNDFRIISSSEDIDKNGIDVLNSEIHGPFNNGDVRIIDVLDKNLSLGKQAFVLPVGRDQILIQTSKVGKLFDVPRPPRDENVSRIMNSLEEIHDRYVSNEGNPYLYGGLDSYIYPEKFIGMAQKIGYPKFASYDLADVTVLNTVRKFVENREIVFVSAWTKENRIDVYAQRVGGTSGEMSVPGINQTLPLISLGLGVLGVVTICCWGGFPFGFAAIVAGVVGISKAISDPDHFGGRELAIGGIAVGAISLFITIIWAVIWLLGSIR